MSIVLLSKEKENRYVSGHAQYPPDGNYNSSFWGYRTALYNRIYEPGYYITDTKYFWESNFYDMSNQKLIYSVQTQSFDPATSESMAHEYGRMIVKNMVSQKILVKQEYTPAKAF